MLTNLLYLTLLPSWMYSRKDKINPKHFLLTAAPCITKMIYAIRVGHTLVNRNSAALTVCAGLSFQPEWKGTRMQEGFPALHGTAKRDTGTALPSPCSVTSAELLPREMEAALPEQLH